MSGTSCSLAMSKGMQQGTGEERLVAKLKPTLNLVSRSATSSPTAPSSSASSRPGILRAPRQQGSNLKAQCAGNPIAGGSKQNDAASSSQVWLTDAKLSERARKPRCCRREPGSEFSKTCKETCRRKCRHQRRGRLEVAAQVAHISCKRSTPRESLLELAKTTQTQARRQNGGPRCEYVDMGNVYDCQPTSRSSSW